MLRVLLRFCRFLIIAASVAVFIGCIPAQVWFAPTLSSDQVLEPSHGVVSLVLIDASTAPLPFNYVTLAPKNMNTSKKVLPSRLNSVAYAPNHTTVFFSSLPEGEYSLENIRGYYGDGNRWYSRWADGGIAMGTFKVKAGQVTDLGEIVLYPKVQGDRYKDILVRIPDSQALPAVPKNFVLSSLNYQDTLTWDDDELDAERQSTYANIVQNPVVFNANYFSEGGSFYLAGKLGFILKRDVEGNWTNDAVDTDFDLNALYVDKNENLVVGGEFGKVFIKLAGQQWQDISLDSRFVIDEIRETKQHQLLVLAHRQRQAKLFTKPISADSDWSEIAVFDPMSGWKNKDGAFFPLGSNKRARKSLKVLKSVSWIDFQGEQFINSRLVAPGEAAYIYPPQDLLHEFNERTLTFKEVKSIADGMDRVISVGGTYLGIKYPSFFSPSSSFYRFDSDSQSWSIIKTQVALCGFLGEKHPACRGGKSGVRKIEFLSTPVFFDDKNAYAIAVFAPGIDKIKGIDKEIFAVTSRNGGASWQYSDTPIPNTYCTETFAEVPDTLLLYCRGSSADFYQSDDHGKTWQHVRESVNF